MEGLLENFIYDIENKIVDHVVYLVDNVKVLMSLFLKRCMIHFWFGPAESNDFLNSSDCMKNKNTVVTLPCTSACGAH